MSIEEISFITETIVFQLMELADLAPASYGDRLAAIADELGVVIDDMDKLSETTTVVRGEDVRAAGRQH